MRENLTCVALNIQSSVSLLYSSRVMKADITHLTRSEKQQLKSYIQDGKYLNVTIMFLGSCWWIFFLCLWPELDLWLT